MSVLDKLATALDRRDEVPNQELAQEILKAGDSATVKELVANLQHKDKGIQGDCIKVLYKVGEMQPDLIAEYAEDFEKLLASKNNRLVWGAMTALDCIATTEPKTIHKMLSRILAASDEGSVITRDHAVGILAKLASLKQYAGECVPLLIEQIAGCPNNQLSMYAEKALPTITGTHKIRFETVIKKRMQDVERESQRKRLTRVLRKLENSASRD